MENKKTRDSFTSRTGFVLACIGSAVGTGNIWRFPTLVSKYGGISFLLPYILFVILIASTGVIEEFALGRAAKAGPVDAFGMCTGIRFGKEKPGRLIGILPILGSMGLAMGYTCVMAWILRYVLMALNGQMFDMGGDMDLIVAAFERTASAFGANAYVLVAVAAAFAIMAFGVSAGIEKANRLLMPVLFFLLAGLAAYVAFLPGAGEGYSYIFHLDPAGLADPKVWIYAFGQAFFSLSVAGNGSVIYGSYLSDTEDIKKSAARVAIFDTLAALLAAFVIIPAMAAGGSQLDAGGPGLMFIYLVRVFNTMPGGRVIGAVFYITVLFAGLSSIINMYEAPVALLEEKCRMKRVSATALILALGGFIAFLIQGITSDWMDVVSIYICPMGALLAGIMYFYVAGREFAEREMLKGSENGRAGCFYTLGKYLYCPAAAIALILGAILGGIG